ncbi:type B 50S ribosomal protein L31 [Nocardioides coralli]|uniref:type B 50S ribosomal protein L31 n=1 Tax=Nocardioides coralli TaxID=2872154 RepID=UPI001CA435CC|nr:type B 50S ribosomal protein L31 [Nocardioides coralli]QZY28190.1 type B 50S ribosomal protein L31 [Nocardioides coralli]
MKHALHPSYGPVLFRDRAAGITFLTRSTLVGRLDPDHPRQTWEDGAAYPVVDVDVSRASHPFWTGRGRVLDTVGRVEKFERRYGAGRKSD